MTSIVAAIQMCSSDRVDENLETVERLVKKAAGSGAKLVVLPETFAMIGKNPQDVLGIRETLGNGKIQDFLAHLASRHNVYVVGGTIPIACKDAAKVRAACLLYNPSGEIIARYDKMHLFDAVVSESESYTESKTTEAGTQIVVTDTSLGKLGLAVCYDIRFPALFTAMRNQGAEIIAVPAAFTLKTGQAHWQLLMRARAVENFCYLVGGAQGGTHANGRKTYGHALAVDPWGTVIDEVTTMGDGIAYVDIQLKKLYEIRKFIPVDSHQKIKLDLTTLK
ncbi:MAG: hypothetical protein ACD_42C00090G0003 [uncultured bacterium]|nr:MAG: hypothetical protein ACD_42C00090G0003 [uncultured bacterium]OGT26218.1 MAG: hypothetical protein A3B71_06830 [Gammaproteobacteria bacterium RIFCSPHIGHO2_02_FULL_42_43]OGT28519.1 MAG: hypothetical protein A2624_00905 [Gammaproteobacteria bacterium RIFCSPHIGHO2_01_FULL_42_8]OGT52595.1 MAG: hypothetical protein A3E54_06430 [Gammaproteobacteria bacterium RIFCSPHIGHO2_12_FULL_41_25]OGT63193.1 MAG: hypothetical protein A3I77_06235 [Gammaproteobacteria bacterium RIFCSPLOWO2_02_FULL_42_14]OGT